MAGPAKVLLVDDDESMYVIYRNRFQEAFGDSVVLDHCPQDRLLDQMLASEHYAVVILDQMLQNGTTGLDLVPTIRRFGQGSRILMNSGYGSEELAAKAVEAGVDGYVLGHKEDLDQLVRTVDGALHVHSTLQDIREGILSETESPLRHRCEILRQKARAKVSEPNG